MRSFSFLISEMREEDAEIGNGKEKLGRTLLRIVRALWIFEYHVLKRHQGIRNVRDRDFKVEIFSGGIVIRQKRGNVRKVIRLGFLRRLRSR